jgi:hypothetical protein
MQTGTGGVRLLGHFHRSRRALERRGHAVRASVQTGEAPSLAREGDPIGLTAEAGGFPRPNHGLATVVTGHGLRYPVEELSSLRSDQ